MAAAVAAALGTPRHRQLSKHSCQRHHRSGKHKRCRAAPRRKPLKAPANPGPGASRAPGAGAISGALNTSGGGGNVANTENPPREVAPVQEPGSGGGGGSGAPSGLAHLQVSAKEFSLTLSHPSTAAGRLQLELVNAGQDEHNLHIRPAAGGPDVGAVGIVLPGHHADVEFNLKPGSYTLYCAIPAHEELGMKATLTVQ
jgi:plastocyanin